MGPYGMGFPSETEDNNGWKLYILSLVMLVSAGIFVVGRLVIRFSGSQFGWDDAAVVGSWISSLAVSVSIQLAISNGYGKHKADLSTLQRHHALKLFFIAQTPYKISVCLNKIAAVLLYLRIFGLASERFRRAAYVIIAIIVAWSIAGVAATIWQCVPIAAAWDKSVKEAGARCIDSDSFWVAYAILNILTDVMVLALPIPSILKMTHLPVRDKILLCGLFLMGGFVTLASIMRTTSVQGSLRAKEDLTFNFIDRGMWTLLEINLGIISTCLLVMKRPLEDVWPWSCISRTRRRSGAVAVRQVLPSDDELTLAGFGRAIRHRTVTSTGGTSVSVKEHDKVGITKTPSSAGVCCEDGIVAVLSQEKNTRIIEAD